MTLPTYKPDAICPKCGETDIHVRYVKGYEYACWPFPEEPTYQTHEGQHLHRYCRRCSYEWGEAVVSYEVAGAAQHKSGGDTES